MQVTVSLRGARVAFMKECKQMKANLNACNSLREPHNVVPCDAAAFAADGGVRLEVPAEPVHFLRLAL